MSSKQSTFVILSPGFPKDEEDSTCLPAQQLFVKKLNEDFPSLEIIIVAFQYPFFKSVYQWNGVEIISLGGQNKRRWKRVATWWRAWDTLRKLKRTKNISGILSFWCTECALVGQWFGKLHHIKHRCWLLGQDAKKANWFVKLIRPASDDLIALSDFLRQEFFNNHGIRPAQVILIGVDTKAYHVNESERDIDVLGVGSLIPLKQYDVFLRVIHGVKKQKPAIKTMICGKGEEKDKLQSLINQLGLNENVFLNGETKHDEVIDLMHKAKVFLHPSSYEGFGIVCLEALHAGTEVISFCKPMEADIPHWHIVGNEDEMVDKILSSLQDTNTQRKSFVNCPIEETVKCVMELYGYKA